MKSPTKTQEAQSISPPARLFIGLMVLGGGVVIGQAAFAVRTWPHLPFLAMLAIALPASRLKLKLPGLNGNMSVNLPFILLAAVALSAFEALMLATVSAAVQSLPRDSSKTKPVQMIFNVSIMAMATGLANRILHGGGHFLSTRASAATLLVLAGTGLLLAQTLPVATIISLTEGGSWHLIWLHIFQLSFPYYVLSTGITSLMTTVSQHVGWQIPLIVLSVMYGIHGSYRVYFRGAEVHPSPPPRAQAAAAS